MKITKVQERRTKSTGKKFYIVNTDSAGHDFLAFDELPTNILGAEVNADVSQKGDTWYIRNIVKKDADFVPEFKLGTPSNYDTNKNIGVTLSYAKDVLVAIAVAAINRIDDFTPDAALKFINGQLEEEHKIFLEALENAQKNLEVG